ncbi:MAG: nitroreductase family protein [Candidatus Bathyarchaeia archaeon]|jgi:nitroreductase
MELYEAVERRRTVREFQSKPVEEEKLMRVLEAGLKAPTHNHLREWEFILLKDFEQREKVVAAAKGKNFSEEEVEKAISKMEEWEKPAYLAALPVQKRMMLTSPELLIVCFRMRKTFKECKTLYDLNNFASVWACIENILLAMAAEELYGVTFITNDTEQLKKMLSIPHGYEVAALIPIGYPKDYFVKQKPISLQKKLHYDRW